MSEIDAPLANPKPAAPLWKARLTLKALGLLNSRLGVILAMAGGAPLKALTLAAEGMEETDRTFRQDLARLLTGEESAVQVAGRWQKLPLDVTLSWLSIFVSGLIRAFCRGDADTAGDLQIFQQNIRLDSLFGYLDEVQAAIARAGTALSPQLVLEGLLIPWSHRLDELSQGGRH